MRLFSLLLLLLLIFSSEGACWCQPLSGTWSGIIQGLNLELVVHVSDVKGGYKATADSVDQGAVGIPATITQSGNIIAITLQTPNTFTFTGMLIADSISGAWKQSGESGKLTLIRGTPSASYDVTGIWTGLLNSQNSNIVVHVINANGQYEATVTGLSKYIKPVIATVLTGRTSVTFSVGGAKPFAFEGRIVGDSIIGFYKEAGRFGPLELFRNGHIQEMDAPIDGDWMGLVEGPNLNLIVHISGAPGNPIGLTDCTDQGATGIDTKIVQVGKAIEIDLATPNPFVFNGILDKNQMSGTWKQLPLTSKLVLTRSSRNREIHLHRN